MLSGAIDYHLDSVPAGRGMLDVNNIVVIYNRVPKTGSTSFIGLAYDLCAKNKFNVIHINTTKNIPTLSLTDQVKYIVAMLLYFMYYMYFATILGNSQGINAFLFYFRCDLCIMCQTGWRKSLEYITAMSLTLILAGVYYH